MSRPEATYRTLEGDVELRLLNGRVVHVAPLSIREAKEMLGLLDRAERAVHAIRGESAAVAGDLEAFVQIVREFPERSGLLDERLEDLGFELDGPDGEPLELGGLRLHDALDLARQYGVAIADPFAVESTRAKMRLLDTLPAAVGLDEDAHQPPVVMQMARALTDCLYLLIYGLAQDFSRTLTESPPVRVLALRAPTEIASLQGAIPSAGSAG